MADVRTPELVINKLSKQQYESIQNPSDTELYLVPEDEELDPHRVIEFQAPTAENNYTWYRKYADGWVEQGGRDYTNNNNTPRKITLPVQMANANGWYPLIQGRTDQQQDTGAQWQVMPMANSNYPESAQWFWVIGSLGQYRLYFQWHVEGMYATE